MKSTVTMLALVAIALAPLALVPAEAPAPPPERVRAVVSLSPSITDSIVDMGASDLLVGVSSRQGPPPGRAEIARAPGPPCGAVRNASGARPA
mgnify:CR=1 FL=1